MQTSVSDLYPPNNRFLSKRQNAMLKDQTRFISNGQSASKFFKEQAHRHKRSLCED